MFAICNPKDLKKGYHGFKKLNVGLTCGYILKLGIGGQI
jgi:hypothetical protein